MCAMGSTVVGVVSEIHRYPVKSMLGERLESGSFAARGLAGDRLHALVDEETGKIVSAKRPKRWGRILELRASGDATTGAEVQISFPDGSSVALQEPEAATRLSELFGRKVSVATEPGGGGFDEEWAGELKGDAEPYFGMPTYSEDGLEMVDGGGFMNVQGNFFDFGAVHILTTGTLRQLGELAPASRFEVARFRPNLVIDTPEDGFLETEWAGRKLAIGPVELNLSFTVPRCVMTTLPMGDDLPGDRAVLRTITDHNAVDAIGSGVRYPCAGIYADVGAAGEISVGDEVTLLPAGS
jgi:uncharacterized protein YcbX